MKLDNATLLITGANHGLRNERRARKTQVPSLHMAFVDTDMTQQVRLGLSALPGVCPQAQG